MNVVDRLKSLVESSDSLKDWEDKAKVMPYLKEIESALEAQAGVKTLGGLKLGLLSTRKGGVSWGFISGAKTKRGSSYDSYQDPMVSIDFGVTEKGFEGSIEFVPDGGKPISGSWSGISTEGKDEFDIARTVIEAFKACISDARKTGRLPKMFGESMDGCGSDMADAIGGAEHYRITCPECKGVTQCRCSDRAHEGVEVVKSSVVCESCKKKEKVGESAEDAQAIAMEIMRQMGGQNKLKAMLGIKGYLTVGASKGFQGGLDLMFQNKVKTAPNRVEILLADNDTYTVRFYRDSKKMQEEEDVYADDLMDLFERSTGLYLTLARR